MKEFVTKAVARCLQCVKNASGKLRTLPWAEQMVAERPSQIVCADYLYMQAGSVTGERYILVLKDSFSQLCRLVSAVSADSLTFVRAILAWSAQFGIPEAIITDGASHFKSSLTAILKRTLKFEAHVTLAYCPWANSQVERHNREILKIFRCLCNERGWPTGRWPDLLSSVELALNSTEVPTLCGKSPIECHTGTKPRSTVEFLAIHGQNIRSADVKITKLERVRVHMEKLRRALAAMHDRVRRKKQSNRKRNWASQKASREPAIHVGDFVMAAEIRNDQSSR